jgi:hypothetical protein
MMARVGLRTGKKTEQKASPVREGRSYALPHHSRLRRVWGENRKL